MNKPVIILGSGGHCRVLIDMLNGLNREIIGITEPNSTTKEVYHLPIIGDDEAIFQYSPVDIELVNGIGSVHNTQKRRQMFLFLKNKGYNFATVVHPSAIIAADVTLDEGVQIMAGTIIQPGCHIGANSIINTKASVDHDCRIGTHVHLAPGVTLSGNCHVDDEVHIGTGATIIQGIHIEGQSLVGAGSVVIRHVRKKTKVIGNPAKEMSR